MGWEQSLSLLPQTDSPMFKPAQDISINLAIALLIHYSFDLGGYGAAELVDRWQKHYPINWLHLAVIEALYQGRYKAFSVQQILSLWQRRGQAVFHFNMEFERLICSKFPESLTSQASLPPLPVQKKPSVPEEINPPETIVEASHREELTLSAATNHPPIGQFTPQTCDRSQSFTSKLRAMSDEKS